MSMSSLTVRTSAAAAGAMVSSSNHAGPTTNSDAITKVMADMNFLQDRMDQLQGHRKPNQAVLRTYTDMLTRRKMVLTMLLAQSRSD